MKKFNNNKWFSKLVLLAVVGYVGYTFVAQQMTLNKYDKEYAYYENKCVEEEYRNQSLKNEKENINSDAYIERVARDKLGLVMPNETIYIDASGY